MASVSAPKQPKQPKARVVAPLQGDASKGPRRLPDDYLEHAPTVAKLRGPKWTGDAAKHASKRYTFEQAKLLVPEGKDWRSLPRAKVRRLPHAAAKALKSARVNFIVQLMATLKWSPLWIPQLAQEWAGHCKGRSGETYISDLASVAHRIVSSHFDPQNLVRDVHVRHTTAVNHLMAMGTIPAYKAMNVLHLTQLKMAGVSSKTPVQAPAPTTTVQVYQVNGETRVKSPVMQAMFRGRLPKDTTTVDVQGTDADLGD